MPLASLRSDVTIPSPTEVATQFDRDGFAFVSALFSDEVVEAMRLECDRLLSCQHLIDFRNLRTLPKPTTEGEQIVERFDPLRDVSPVFDDILQDKRMMPLTPL